MGAHADDIEIGCGGTILRITAEIPDIVVRWNGKYPVHGQRGKIRKMLVIDLVELITFDCLQ